MSSKVIVIGLDGATWDILDKFSGKLKFINSKKSSGSYGKLKTVIPSGSAASWVSFSTGKNPGKHGIISWEKKAFTQNFITSSDIKENEIWDILSRNGMKCCILCPPVSFPPKKINGLYVSGIGRPSTRENFVYPENMKNEVENYIEDFNALEYMKTHSREDAINEMKELTRKKTDLFLKFIKDNDFGFVLYDEFDKVQHFFLNDENLLGDYFGFVDNEIKRISEDLSDSNIFILSDHGFNKAPEKSFFINTWLLENGFLPKTTLGIIDRIKIFLYPLGKDIFGRLTKSDTPRWMKIFVPHQENVIKDTTKDPDIMVFNNFSIYIKLKSTAKEISEKLKSVQDPQTGKNIFKHVYTKDEVYSGRYIENMPDVVFIMDSNYNVNTNFSTGLFSEASKSIWEGYHTFAPYGMFLCFGPDLENFKTDAHITDLTPTILHLLRLPVPEDCDGHVLEELLKFKNDIIYSKSDFKETHNDKLNLEEEEKIKKKLKELGYI